MRNSFLIRDSAGKFMMRTLVALLTLSTACFATQITLGATASDVQPLLGGGGQVLQWNVSTFAGGMFPGSYDGNPCGGFEHCYGFNGTDWQFNFTGNNFCKAGCSYYASGPIKLGKPVKLPDGSTTIPVSAILTGTFTNEKGIVQTGVLGYFNSFTSPANDSVTVMGPGGLTIVLADN